MNQPTINGYKATEYTQHGCNFQGNLMIFEYWEAVQIMNRNKDLNGWGQSTYRDAIDEIEKHLKTQNIKYKIKLHVPDFVIQIIED
jgi:hypothetical protein